MTFRALVTLTSAVLATAPLAAAVTLSCAHVECPIEEGTTSAICRVAGDEFGAVGVVDIETDNQALDGLTWTKAVGADTLDGERTYRQTFYLGTPEGFNLNNTGSCAVFFDKVSDKVKFGDLDVRNADGKCRDAMSEACVTALLDRAKKVDFSGLSSQEACAALEKEFSENLDSACAQFSTLRTGWADVHVHRKIPAISGSYIPRQKTRADMNVSAQIALSGEDAPEPISDQQNSTSTCWPVLPKNNDLTLVQTISAKVLH